MDGIGLWEGLKSPGAMGGLQKKIGPFNLLICFYYGGGGGGLRKCQSQLSIFMA